MHSVRDPGVTHQTDHLDVAGSELGLKFSECAQLGGADRSEVIRVGEENGPAVPDVVVEGNRAVGGLSLEVGGSRAETETAVSKYLLYYYMVWIDRDIHTERVPEPL